MAAIDRYLPAWDVNEAHETVVGATPERALAALLATSAAADTLVGSLLRLRGIRRQGSIEELLAGIGFERLAREPEDVVFGASGRPWRPGGGMRQLRGRVAGNRAGRREPPRRAAFERQDPALDGDSHRRDRRRRATRVPPLLDRRRPVLRAHSPALAGGGSPHARGMTQGRAFPMLALVGVTAVWGITFVQVQNALELYPLFAFLAVRFAISTAALAPFAWRSVRTLPREGVLAGVGVGALVAAAFGFQTAGLELTTVSSTGFITGLYVVFTPLIALVLFGTRVPVALWIGVAFAVAGLLLLNGAPGGSALGNALVLVGALAAALQIAALERYAPRYDPRALTFLQMATAFVGFAVIAVALGQVEVPRGATVWAALLVTGLFSGALGYLVATWVQARTTAARAALVFTLEAPFAALAGVLLADEVLGWAGWLGCAVMMTGILLAEPAAASALRRFLPRERDA